MQASPEQTDESVVRREFDALLVAAVDGIIVIDADGTIEEFNPAAERLFGYGREEAIGQNVNILMPEPTRSQHSEFVSRYIAGGDAKIIGKGREVQARRSDGSLFPVWLSVGETTIDRGSMFVGIVRDLSAEHEARAKHAELEARLAHVGRFSLMGEMAGGIAHEINQPLSAITTYAQAGRRLLESGEFGIEELQKICNRISEQTHRAGAVIDNLRNFFRKNEPDSEAIYLNDVINDVLEFVRLDARNADIDVHLNLASDMPPVSGNDVQIQQVLLNLTRNAVDAMRGSREVARRNGIVIKTRVNAAGNACFSVEDHGPGVATGLNEAVFHPFVSTKDAGLGVGLAISKTIVESHDGKISYHKGIEGGAVFEAEFPPDAQAAQSDS